MASVEPQLVKFLSNIPSEGLTLDEFIPAVSSLAQENAAERSLALQKTMWELALRNHLLTLVVCLNVTVVWPDLTHS